MLKTMALFLPWLLLWANINSGPWNMRSPVGVIGWMNAGRAALPFFVVLASLTMMLLGGENGQIERWGATRLLAIYGGFCIVSSMVVSPEPRTALYFGLAFMATFLALEAILRGDGGADRVRLVVKLNWLLMAVLSIGTIYVGRDVIFSGRASAYGIVGAVGDVAGMPMSRSSGVARFAAVPALVAFCRLWDGKSWRRLAWGPVFLFFAYVVYRMQSRGAIFGLAGALAFVLVANRARVRTALLGAVLVVLLLCSNPKQGWMQRVTLYLARGQDVEQLESMTGRTRAWQNGYEAFLESPIVLGYGAFGDRLTIHEHVHNTYLQALMFGGLIGFGFFIASWARGWLAFTAVYRQQKRLSERDWALCLEAGAVLAFFTIRSIPETTTASYSVDLLVVVPILALLESMKLELKGAGVRVPGTGRLKLRLRPCRTTYQRPMEKADGLTGRGQFFQ